jgi:hypothetical protein
VTCSPALPGEFSRLMDWLEPVDPGRRGAIARMVFAEVDTCPTCDESVRRCDPRWLVGDRLRHRDCARAS